MFCRCWKVFLKRHNQLCLWRTGAFLFGFWDFPNTFLIWCFQFEMKWLCNFKHSCCCQICKLRFWLNSNRKRSKWAVSWQPTVPLSVFRLRMEMCFSEERKKRSPWLARGKAVAGFGNQGLPGQIALIPDFVPGFFWNLDNTFHHVLL